MAASTARLGTSGRGWEKLLDQRHAGYCRARVVDGQRERARAQIWRTHPEVLNRGDLGGGCFRGVYTGFGPPDYIGTVGEFRYVADAKEHHAPRKPNTSGTYPSDRWGFDVLRPIQAAAFDRAERADVTSGAFLLLNCVARDNMHRAHLIPWIGRTQRGTTVRELWWRWFEHHRQSIQLKSVGGSPEPAPPGTASLDIGDLLGAAIYSDFAPRFDYLNALAAWMDEEREARAVLQRGIPEPPTDEELMQFRKLETGLARQRKARRNGRGRRR